MMAPRMLFHLVFYLLIIGKCSSFVSQARTRRHFGPSGRCFGPPNVQVLTGNNDEPSEIPTAGRLEELKQEETKLASMLASVRREKLAVLRGKYFS